MADLLTINNSGKIGGAGKLNGNINNTGTVYAQDGIYDVTGFVSGAGVLEIDPGGFLKIGGTVSGQAVNFAGVGAALSIGSATGLTATINGFQTGDMIVVPNAAPITQSFDPVTQTLSLIDNFGSTVASLTFTGTHTAADFTQAVTTSSASQISVVSLAADKPESVSGSTPFTFNVIRAGDTSVDQTVTWAVAGTGANPADATDFAGGALPTGTVTFGAGEISKAVTINVAGDSTAEADEGFSLTLSDPTAGAVLNATTAVGTIRDDDSGADLNGVVYNWKSHALLSGADVTALGSGNPGGVGTAPIEFRTVHTDASGHLVADLWGNAGAAATSFNTTLGFPTDVTAAFQAASLPSDWAVTPTPNSGSLALNGTGTTALTGFTQLGTLTFTLPVGSTRVDVKITDGMIGGATAVPLTVTYGKATTAADGAYALATLPKDQYKISVDRDTSDSTKAITSLDALAALRLAVGLNPNPTPLGGVQLQVSPYQFIAADVTGDGKVTSADALAILRMAVKQPTAKVPLFQMVPEQTTFWNPATQTFSVTKTSVPTGFASTVDLQANSTRNLVGVLTGDVNGSWVPLDGSGNPLASFPKEPDTYFTDVSKANANVPIDLWGVNPNPVTGGTANDTLVSTAGRDLLTGGTGADIFQFLAAGDSVVGANRDAIKDFSSAQGDIIELTAIDANDLLPGDQGFSFLGTSAFTGGPGEVRYEVTGSDAIVQGTISGIGSSFEIKLIGVTTLVDTDFHL